MSGPRPGPCAPWVSGEELAALAPIQAAAAKQIADQKLTEEALNLVCAGAADAASLVLYELSGRQFTGECGPVTIRPVSRPTDADTRTWGSLNPNGWISSWGMCSAYGADVPGVVTHHGCSNPPEISLGAYPVTEIVQVLIDGIVIPGPYDPGTQTGEWELRDHRWLVRLRPTASAVPTERYGWPTCQILDLPDTEQGTFSITYRYGMAPPGMGRMAALALGKYLALPQLGNTTHFPKRVKQVTRQGVQASTTDVEDFVSTGNTGIFEVDLFIKAVNPGKNQRQAMVYSPDVGRPRRTAFPSLPS